jgi:COPI associated protein
MVFSTLHSFSAVPRMILYTRIANLVLSVCMILASLVALFGSQDATTGVLACYVMAFSCLLCCFETHLKQISKIIALNFGFLYSAKSRSAFMIFVGM